MATLEMEATERFAESWKSPLRKLVRFFEASRDRWKAKYMESKKERKLMGNQVRAVEKSRDKWRQVAQQARQEVRQLEQELEQYKKSAA